MFCIMFPHVVLEICALSKSLVTQLAREGLSVSMDVHVSTESRVTEVAFTTQATHNGRQMRVYLAHVTAECLVTLKCF